MGIHPEENLAELYRLSILDQNLTNSAGDFGFDLIHDFHRLDDTDCLPGADPVAHLDVRVRAGLGRLVERTDHRRPNLLEVKWGAGRAACGLPRLRFPGQGSRWRCMDRRGHGHRRRGRRRSRRGSGDHDSGAEPSLHIDRSDLRRLSQELGEALDVLEIDGMNAGHVLQQLGELLHLLRAHTRVRYLSSRRSTRITWPSSMKSGTWTMAPGSRVAGLVPPGAVSPRKPGGA